MSACAISCVTMMAFWKAPRALSACPASCSASARSRFSTRDLHYIEVMVAVGLFVLALGVA